MSNEEIEDSDAESFKSAEDGDANDSNTTPIASRTDDIAGEPTPLIERFSPEEEVTLLNASNSEKAQGNALFTTSDFSGAIQMYEKSLASCPNYLEYEIAVLKANIAACHLKLLEWQSAVDAATAAIEALERLDPSPLGKKTADGTGVNANGDKGENTHTNVIEEVDDQTAERIEALNKSGRSREDVLKIRTKALMRRAKGREELGGWAHLAGAQEDYKYLSSTSTLSSLDRKTVNNALLALPPRLDAAKQKEMSEMMGKLKDLGNGILKPFGLSTDNFQFVKDEKTGGYSMNFNQGAR